MSTPLALIATGLVAFTAGWATTQPMIRRLRASLADALWRAHHDPLTGLLNRAGLVDLHERWQRAHRPVITVLIDLDHFKPINDTYGHHAGDTLLTTIAARLDEAATMFGGHAARLGGDEFVLHLPVRLGDLCRRLELIGALIAQPVHIRTNSTPLEVRITASIGVCLGAPDDTLPDLLHRADIALYQAKRVRGIYVLHQPGLYVPTARDRRGPRLRDLTPATRTTPDRRPTRRGDR